MAGVNNSVAVTGKMESDDYSDLKTDRIRSDIDSVGTFQSIADGQSKSSRASLYPVSGAA